MSCLFFLISCTTSEIPPEKQCSVDEDCVPAECCHPTDVVNKNYAPDCAGIFCTMDCQGGTLDCQQGEIKCLQGECQAVIFDD